MIKKRTIEIFSSGCPLCIDVIRRIYQIAGNTCTVSVLDVHDPLVVDWADRLHIHKVPAVVVDGTLLDCCAHTELDEDLLRSLGIDESVNC